ncbi:hypothetical protein [Pedobacter sp.]|uniref:hypothetical protein n=1 Tax=Pedobacter sp. TaxID=1411316 RepID=UPI003BA8D87F
MRYFIIIICIIFFGCKNKAKDRLQNVNEEVQVILNTFENGIIAVSENDFKVMHAKIHQIHTKAIKSVRKYTVTDSLLSMSEFQYFNRTYKLIPTKTTVPFEFKASKHSFSRNFEIIKISRKEAKLDSNYNGNLTFSRVIFNKERNKAKYYFEQSKLIGLRGVWGMGTYIYAKKVNGVWIFDKEEELWIT